MLKRKANDKKNEPRALSCNYEESSHVSSSFKNNYSMSVPTTLPSLCSLTSTPGRTRNIDQDMEALRLSRQDNPFIQKVLNSRENLDCLEESSSDDTILMSQEFSSDLEADLFALPEIHEHMIRSPPPTSWSRSPNSFRYPSYSDDDNESFYKSQYSIHNDLMSSSTPTSMSSQLLTKSRPSTSDKFLLLNAANSLKSVRRPSSSNDDNIQLMSTIDN